MSVHSGKEYSRNGDKITWTICGYDATHIKQLFLGEMWKRHSVVFGYRASYPVMRPCDKTIPLWVLQGCRKRELRALLRGLMAGDGHWDVEGSRGTYYTSSARLADSVQYLLVLANYRSRLRSRRGNSYEIAFSENQFVDISKRNVKVVLYTGGTWCVTTALGTIVTRHNGCVAIVGNSPTDYCEVLIIDDNAVWFMPRYRGFAAGWFMKRWRGSLERVPEPLV